ncbi:MAG: hypothetical protein RLN78_00815 [Phycisphaerales bacterium]
MKRSERGSLQAALALQKSNGVPTKQAGVWYHGTNDPGLQHFTSKGPDLYLTRSQRGGKSHQSRVIKVMVVETLHKFRPTEAAVGDMDGVDPADPTKRLPDWNQIVKSNEVHRLMIIEENQISKNESQSDNSTQSEMFEKQLTQPKEASDDSKEELSE